MPPARGRGGGFGRAAIAAAPPAPCDARSAAPCPSRRPRRAAAELQRQGRRHRSAEPRDAVEGAAGRAGRSRRSGGRGAGSRPTTATAAAARSTTTRSSSIRTAPTRSGRSTPTSSAAPTAARPGSRRTSRAPACTSITTSLEFDPIDPTTCCSATTAASTRSYDEGQDVPLLREPADHAVLSRVGGQREAVLQRLRRHAGQLVVLRPVAHR